MTDKPTPKPIENKSLDNDRVWAEDGLLFTEVARQDYDNCYIAAGFVEGHLVDTMFIEFSKSNATYLMRPDEMAALAWCITGALYSLHIKDVPPDSDDPK